MDEASALLGVSRKGRQCRVDLERLAQHPHLVSANFLAVSSEAAQ